MARYKLTIEYDGTPYCGWQRQNNGHTPQQAIEDAIFDFCSEHTPAKGAGRTDTGVHAKGQIAHIDLQKEWAPKTVRDAINANLIRKNESTIIVNAERVSDAFDARFSATKRYYLYRIINRKTPIMLERNRAWWVHVPLDIDAMHRAAQFLVGRHDFTTFRTTHCQAKSPIRTIDKLSVTKVGDVVEIRAEARSFLHSQIRSFAGSLKLVGAHKWKVADMETALLAKDRHACGPVAPPAGLYFLKVDYPDIIEPITK